MNVMSELILKYVLFRIENEVLDKDEYEYLTAIAQMVIHEYLD